MIGERRARPLMSVSEAADLAGVSRSVAYQWARTGHLPGCVQIEGRYYVRAAPFLRWLEGQDDPPATLDRDELDAARARSAVGVGEGPRPVR